LAPQLSTHAPLTSTHAVEATVPGHEFRNLNTNFDLMSHEILVVFSIDASVIVTTSSWKLDARVPTPVPAETRA
jgi:hypothetical protein